MSNQSIIEHKSNMYYVEFREDFLLICLYATYKKPLKSGQKNKASAYCKALILAILESWTNVKRANGDDLFVYMSYPQWVDAMYGMFGRSVVIDSLDELLGEGLISREAYRMFGKDTYKYLLNYVEINKRMKDLKERDPHVTSPQIDASTSKRDAFTNKRDTRLLVDATDLLVDDDPFTSRHNIESYITSSQHLHIDPSQSNGDDANAHHPPTLASVIRQENAAYDALIVESTLEDITEQSPSGSYSQQDATGNPLLENGEDHVLPADRDCDPAHLHTLRVTQAQQPTLENDNNSHSHSQEIRNGLMDEPTAGNLDNSRPAAVPRSDRNAFTQDACTDTRRTADAGSAGSRQHSRGSGRTLHADPPVEARQQDAAVGRANHEGAASLQGVSRDVRSQQTGQAQTATGRAVADVVGQAQAEGSGLPAVPIAHQGRAQTTPSPSVGNSNPEGEGKKPARGRRKPKVIDPEQMNRVNKVYDAFDKVAQEVSGDPDFHYSRTKNTTKAITDWLASKPTEKLLRDTYTTMVNTPADPRTGFAWADNMSIEAVIRQCDKRRLSVSIKGKRMADNHVVTASTPTTMTLPIYEDEEEEYKPNFVLLSRMQGGMKHATTYASQQH